MILGLGLEIENRFRPTNGGTDFLRLGRVLVWAPLDPFEVVLGDERFVHGVTLVVTYSNETIVGPCDEVTIFVPVTDCDFLSVLGDAGDLAISFAVEENDGALF